MPLFRILEIQCSRFKTEKLPSAQILRSRIMVRYGETSLKERICFASNWGTQSMPVEKLIAQVEALPFSDDAKEHILYNNAKTFYEQL